ncbi:LPS export ABC transporter permease LptG [Psychromonas antarctica]|jgi:lipopolysaccharide export system permease protein|uniref:LPS export ABC transporter permease LptG n=1 Tax=Psychromonas antarctica TaxID=67573 RepID=UPI001EE793AA|nr:LPS export ABC transporter permease LptG [Psychromonas antarctica]MCG6201934.1 LPS export ABC transporter permease LptG [Psychromonas antarctica]
MGILDRYIGKTIFAATFFSMFILIGLSSIIKFVEQMKGIGQGTYDVWAAAYFVLLKMPIEITVFFPMAALIGALVGLGSLATSSELVVMQAAGLSKLRIASSVLKTAIPMVLIVMVLGEFVAPKTDKEAYSMREQAKRGEEVISSKYGVWVKDGDDFVSIGRMNSKAELFTIQLYFFDKEMKLSQAMVAQKAIYQQGNWLLQNVSRTFFGLDKINTENMPEFVWKTELTPKKIEVVLSDPDKMSMRDIYSYIIYLERNDQDGSRYWLSFWRKAVLPFTVIVMMLLSVSFIFGGLRSVTMGTRLIFGIASGFTFYVLGELFGPFSLVFDFPPVLGALLPSLLVLTIAMYLLKRQS